jgi:hypothetical protein
MESGRCGGAALGRVVVCPFRVARGVDAFPPWVGLVSSHLAKPPTTNGCTHYETGDRNASRRSYANDPTAPAALATQNPYAQVIMADHRSPSFSLWSTKISHGRHYPSRILEVPIATESRTMPRTQLGCLSVKPIQVSAPTPMRRRTDGRAHKYTWPPDQLGFCLCARPDSQYDV